MTSEGNMIERSYGGGLDEDSDSRSSTSIGKNSDCSEGSSDQEDDEAQSSLKGPPLDTMDALEEALPTKKSISKFYSGKSRSFTSLSDATSLSSIKDMVKPENPYNKKLKNLLLHHKSPDKTSHVSSRKDSGVGTSQMPISHCQSSFPCKLNIPEAQSSSPSSHLPPLHPQGRKVVIANEPLSSCPSRQNPPWRSFSLSDLQSVAEKASGMPQVVVFSGNKCNQFSQDSSLDSISQLRKVEESFW